MRGIPVWAPSSLPRHTMRRCLANPIYLVFTTTLHRTLDARVLLLVQPSAPNAMKRCSNKRYLNTAQPDMETSVSLSIIIRRAHVHSCLRQSTANWRGIAGVPLKYSCSQRRTLIPRLVCYVTRATQSKRRGRQGNRPICGRHP